MAKEEKNRAYDYLVQSKGKIETKNYANAIVDLDKAILLNPDFVPAYINRGNAKISLAKSKHEKGYFVEAQQLLQSAIDEYTKTIRVHQDNALTYNNRADAKLHLGKTEAKMGNVQTANDSYQNALIDINIVIKELIASKG